MHGETVTLQPALFDTAALPPLCQRCERKPSAWVIEFIPKLRRDGELAGDTIIRGWLWTSTSIVKPPSIAVCNDCKEKIINV